MRECANVCVRKCVRAQMLARVSDLRRIRNCLSLMSRAYAAVGRGWGGVGGGGGGAAAQAIAYRAHAQKLLL